MLKIQRTIKKDTYLTQGKIKHLKFCFTRKILRKTIYVMRKVRQKLKILARKRKTDKEKNVY